MLSEMLRRIGYEVHAEPNGLNALRRLKEFDIKFVMTDLLMPEKDGLETIQEIRTKMPNVKIVAMSGGGRLNKCDYLQMARKLGADSTLSKPFSRDELKAALASIGA